MTKQQASETMKRLLLKCEQGAAWTDADMSDFLTANSVDKRGAVAFAEAEGDDGPLREAAIPMGFTFLGVEENGDLLYKWNRNGQRFTFPKGLMRDYVAALKAAKGAGK